MDIQLYCSLIGMGHFYKKKTFAELKRIYVCWGLKEFIKILLYSTLNYIIGDGTYWKHRWTAVVCEVVLSLSISNSNN